MKKEILLASLALCLFAGFSCTPKFDAEKEKAAVIKLVEEETAAYYATDFNRWAATYCQDSDLVVTYTSKYGTGLTKGWEKHAQDAKDNFFFLEKGPNNELKIPVTIRVHPESALIIFEEYTLDSTGMKTNPVMITCMLEKTDGKWKIAYRSIIDQTSYINADYFVLSAIGYAKSLGKPVEEVASFTGDLFKQGWTQAGFKNAVQYNWRNSAPPGKFKFIQQSDKLIQFEVADVFLNLKNAGTINNVTYDDYLNYMKVINEKIAGHVGMAYTQEKTELGVMVTVSDK